MKQNHKQTWLQKMHVSYETDTSKQPPALVSVCFDCDGLTGDYIGRGHYCGVGVMSINAGMRLVPVFAGYVVFERPLAAWAPPVYGSGFGVRGPRAPRHSKHA